MKIIKVSCCMGCPNRDYNNTKNWFYCKHPLTIGKQIGGARELENMPSWCPLEDYPSINNPKVVVYQGDKKTIVE